MSDIPLKKRKRALEFETLESVTLLSGLAATAIGPAAPAMVHAMAATPASTVNITTRGFYSVVKQNPDTGSTYYFYTSGFSPSLGFSIVAGAITTPGNVMVGTASGTLTVYSSKGGTLTLNVSAPARGFAPLPATLRWTVTAGTGIFAGASGTGSVTDALHKTWGTTTGPQAYGGGFATLTFRTARFIA